MADWTGMQPRPRVKVISSGGVVYRWENGNPLFLLLGSNKRGVREETGVSRVKLRGKVGQIKYQFGYRAKTFDKTVHFFLFETDQTDSKVGSEHDFEEWLPYDQALQSLSYPNEKEMLSKDWSMIQDKASQP